MLKRILCLLTVTLLASTFVFSQVTTSSLTGHVAGPDGKALVGATIVATHTPSGTSYTSISQSPNGQFTISNMRVGGPYHIEVSFVGFETQKFDEVYLKLGEAFILDAPMKAADNSLQTVVIATTGRSTLLNANRTGAVTNIGRREIQTLPSITRSLNDLTRLTPQANGTSIGGGNYRSNYITVDGSDFNNTFGIGTNLPAGGSPISLDALDEISVNIAPFDIRQSGFTGSSINAITRSGTNRFQGSVYRYWRSEKQQGDEVNGVKFTRNPFSFEQWGARIGGPIIKNKLFFFLNYETENQPKQVQSRVAATTAGTFGGNVARPTRDSLIYMSNYLRSTYGYETGPFDNYSTEIARTKFLARIDWNINSHHRFNIRYNQVEGGEPNPPSTSRSPLTSYTTGAGRTDINALWFKNSNYFQGANFYSLAAELNSSFGSRISNTLRGTYTYQNDSRESDSQDFPFVDILSFGSPYTSFGYEPFSKGNLRKVTTYSFVDNLTWTKGKHTATLGTQMDFSKTINGFQRFATSYYTFATWNDFVSGGKPQDFAITYSTQPKFAQAFPSFKFAQYSFYAQDEFAVNNRLRLTGGVRVDLPTYPDVAEIKTHPLIAQLTFSKGEKINTGTLPKATPLWSPRVGFNWDVNGDRTFQIRGGTGIFSGRVPFVWIVSQSGDAGLLQVTQTFVGQANTPGPFNANPAAYLPSSPPVAGTIIPSTISALDPNFKFPQTWKTNLAFDKKLPWNLVLTVETIFNKDLNTAVFRNPNLVDPQPLVVAGYPDQRTIYPISNTQKFINPLTNAGLASPTGTAAFNTIVMDNDSKGYSFFGTVKLDKQFSKGWFASISYTKAFGENLFDGSGDQPLSAWQGTANVNGSNFPMLGYNGNIVPDHVLGSISYRKEYLKHLGTTISLFYEGAIQGRFSYLYSADFNRDGTNLDLIYIPRDPSEINFVDLPAGTSTGGVAYTAAQQSALFFQYIDQDKYLRKHKGQYAERNGARQPWRNQFDVKLMQDLFVNLGKNRNTIQFTLDIFNVGNLINSNWGKFYANNASSILVPVNVTGPSANPTGPQNFTINGTTTSILPYTAGGTTKPYFRLATDRNHPVTQSFRDVVSISSTYYMQFGLRYLFN